MQLRRTLLLEIRRFLQRLIILSALYQIIAQFVSTESSRLHDILLRGTSLEATTDRLTAPIGVWSLLVSSISAVAGTGEGRGEGGGV